MTFRECRLPLHPPAGWRRLVGQMLGTVLPINDPDFVNQQESVAYWWLELDQENVAKREIGFAAEGHPIRCAPAFDNWGLFVGETVSSAHLATYIKKDEFEHAWKLALQDLARRRER